MIDLNMVYESEDLFPLFSNRLLSDSRPEYGKVLQWLGIGGANCQNILLDMLAMTEGIRATDTFEVFKCPAKNLIGQYEVDFFIHGLRRLTKKAVERVNKLTRGDRVYLAWDVQNKYDSAAIILRTDDPVELIGYSPRYLSPDFRYLLEKNNPLEVLVTVERVNQDAPLNLRLLCKLVAPWPAGFQPCSEENFQPLAEYPDQEELRPPEAYVAQSKASVAQSEASSHSPVVYPVPESQGDARLLASEKSNGLVDRLPAGLVPGSTEKPLNNYQHGAMEKKKADHQLRDHGATVKVTPVSRNAASLKVKFPSGKSWKVQVKSTGLS
jgi:hypothetical protein